MQGTQALLSPSSCWRELLELTKQLPRKLFGVRAVLGAGVQTNSQNSKSAFFYLIQKGFFSSPLLSLTA